MGGQRRRPVGEVVRAVDREEPADEDGKMSEVDTRGAGSTDTSSAATTATATPVSAQGEPRDALGPRTSTATWPPVPTARRPTQATT